MHLPRSFTRVSQSSPSTVTLRRSYFCYHFAAIFFAQFLQQPMLTRKATGPSNFGQRPNGGVLRSPAMFMFYDFAPHRDGANNGRVPAVPGCVALGLLFSSECVIPEVVSE
jgi:hypothetical protein